MSASTCACGADTFADFDRCAEHVPRRAMVAEIVRLRACLALANGATPERSRHENHRPANNRPETTILERM